MSRASVLLVEDDGDLRRALGKALALRGFEIYPASDAEAARAALAARRFDAVLTDWSIPGNGAGVIADVERQTPGTPVVVLSALEPEESTLQSPVVREWLRKPVHVDRLAETLRRVIGD